MRIPPPSAWPPWILLLNLAAILSLANAVWLALLNNYAVERAGFTGLEIGILQSVREIPGFLAFGVLIVLAFMREQRLAYISLVLLGLGVMATGFRAEPLPLYLTTVLMSVGFHYFETVKSSLSLQWIPKERAPVVLGWIMAAGSAVSLLSYLAIGFATSRGVDYPTIYFVGGFLTILGTVASVLFFPMYEQPHTQHRKILLRRRYSLYYVLTFLSGARRQIFVVFAPFLLVEKFGFPAAGMSVLLLGTTALNMLMAPVAGEMIRRFGERRALIFEYVGLIGVFAAYSVASSAAVAVALYVIDHLFFALATSQKTYFQKIAAPGDIASTASVSFAINHIAAVVLPVTLGTIWIVSPGAVFLTGSTLAAVSLAASCLIPRHPAPGREVIPAGRWIARRGPLDDR